MHYLDTRSGQRQAFADILLSGISPAGGLWTPERIPTAPRELQGQSQMRALHHAGAEKTKEAKKAKEVKKAKTGFAADAAALALPFVGDWVDGEQLHQLFAQAWAHWAESPPPLRQIDDGIWLMELFHGPSLAFKDYGLSFLAACFDLQLARRDEYGIALVATSGDTGAAAVQALGGLERLQLVVLLPEGRISDVQRAQMTRGIPDSVHPILVDGTFDDCQTMVKHCLGQGDLLRPGQRFLSVNSINFGRVLAQMSYYHSCVLGLKEKLGTPIDVAVPSGNFGNAYAAWLARSGGTPIERILLACNDNDSLHRFVQSGHFQPGATKQTLSPAMDISLPSNLERLLFEFADFDGERLRSWRGEADGSVTVDQPARQKLRQCFSSSTQSDACTVAEMAKTWKEKGVVLDPHTAVAVAAVRRHRRENPGSSALVAATAHPCKFPEALQKADIPQDEAALPETIEKRMKAPERFAALPSSPEALRDWLVSLNQKLLASC